MPTAKTVDDVPMTATVGASGGSVSILAYIEARIRDQKEASGIEIQAMREMLLRFRDDSHQARAEVILRFDRQLEERDLRYAQRFSASQEALAAAMSAADRAIQAALLSQKEAVAKAETASNSRFQSVNEFRQQLADQTNSFIPRTEATARLESLSEKLDTLSSRLDRSEGTGKGLNAGWAILVSIIGIVGTIAAIAIALIKLSP